VNTQQVPEFARGSSLVESAWRLTVDVHAEPERYGATELEHPIEVARVLHQAGFDESVVAAALLHEVVEDTPIDAANVRRRFGPEVGGLVAAMTEDQRIEEFPERKREHRDRIRRTGGKPAAMFAADKLVKAREIQGEASSVPDEKIDHYQRTLHELCEENPELPFLRELDGELRAVSEERSQAPRTYVAHYM
jgi:hypothetical protein